MCIFFVFSPPSPSLLTRAHGAVITSHPLRTNVSAALDWSGVNACILFFIFFVIRIKRCGDIKSTRPPLGGPSLPVGWLSVVKPQKSSCRAKYNGKYLSQTRAALDGAFVKCHCSLPMHVYDGPLPGCACSFLCGESAINVPCLRVSLL